jgi:hypothetical protein
VSAERPSKRKKGWYGAGFVGEVVYIVGGESVIWREICRWGRRARVLFVDGERCANGVYGEAAL